MRPNMPAESEWLSVKTFSESPPKVDRDKNVIHGVVIAEQGKMKDGRGFFSESSLRAGIALANQKPEGIKSRLQHKNLSDDGTAKFLGRQKNNRLEGGKWLADMHLDASSFVSPAGNLGEYVMTRAESDADSFGTSLVGKFDFFDPDGQKLDSDQMERAQEKAPGETHWVPTMIHSSDVVDSGNATNSFLSEDHLFDGPVRTASKFMDETFGNQSREVVKSRVNTYLDRYLDNRQNGEEEMSKTETLTVDLPENVIAPVVSAVTTVPAVPEKTKMELLAEIIEDKPAEPLSEDVEFQSATERAAEISQLCLLAGCSSKAAPLISNVKLSAADVREYLAQKVCLDNSLSDDVPDDPFEEKGDPQESLDEKKYNLNKDHYLKHGVTLDRFKISEGVERNNGFVKPTNAVILQ